jgi:hypothetical protein
MLVEPVQVPTMKMLRPVSMLSLWVLCLAFVLETPAWSQSTIYLDDRGGFESDAITLSGNFQRILDFPAVNGPELTVSDLTFRGNFLVASPNGVVLWNFDGSAPGLRIHFANGARAFGADFSSSLSPYYSSFTATVSLDSGESFQFTAPTDPGFRFFGFISPTPIRDMTFSDGGLLSPFNFHEELLGNVTVVTVPESSSLALLGIGGVLLAGHWLRRFRKQ